MATPTEIGKSAQKVYRHFKKHYDDITALVELTQVTVPGTQARGVNTIPDDLMALVSTADHSLQQFKQHTGNIDELASLASNDLQTQKPELCSALAHYKQDLDKLFDGIQAIRAKAGAGKRKSAGKAKTKRF